MVSTWYSIKKALASAYGQIYIEWLAYSGSNTNSERSGELTVYDSGTGSFIIAYFLNSTTIYYPGGSMPSAVNTWYKFKALLDTVSKQVSVWVDDVLKANNIAMTTLANISSVSLDDEIVHVGANGSVTTWYDVIRTRKYAIPAPSIGSFEPQETYGLPRKKIYLYYGNPNATPASDPSIGTDIAPLTGLVGLAEAPFSTIGLSMFEHPAIKRIDFYDSSNKVVWSKSDLTDIAAGRIIRRVHEKVDIQAVISYVNVVTAANKVFTFKL